MHHDGLSDQLQNLSFLGASATTTESTDTNTATAKTKTARVRKSRAKPTKPAKTTKKLTSAQATVVEAVGKGRAAALKTEGCFNPGPAAQNESRQNHPKMVMHDAYGWAIPVSFALPAQTRVLGGGSEVRLGVPLGRNNMLLITGPGVEDINLAKFPKITGLMKASRVGGEPRKCNMLVIELSDDVEPRHELQLGNQPGAFQTKDLGDCMLSLVRLTPAPQELELAA